MSPPAGQFYWSYTDPFEQACWVVELAVRQWWHEYLLGHH